MRRASEVAAHSGVRVLSCSGRPDETGLPFVGLADVLRPLTVQLATLPEVQGKTLRGALGLGPVNAADRFAVYSASLSLLLQAASDQPTLIVVDDVHLLDAPSQDALAFIKRRVVGEPLGMLVTMVDPATRHHADVASVWDQHDGDATCRSEHSRDPNAG